MEKLNKTYMIQAPIVAVWQALTDEKMMKKWGAGPAEFTAKVDAEFYMWGDYLTGKVVEVKEPFLLVEDWLADGFDEPSKVTFKLTEVESNQTKVELIHEKIPTKLVQDIDEGWDDFYLGAIKDYLEDN